MRPGRLAAFLAAALIVAPLAGAAAQATGSIAGRVTAVGDQPLAGAQVQALLGGRARAAASGRDDGTFRLDGLAPGRYTVVVRRVGYQPGSDTVDVAAGQTAQLQVTLQASVTQLSEVVTTASRGTEKILDAPASISVVSAEQIAERPALTVVDNLRSVPGLDVAQGGLVQSAVVARGFNNVFSGALLTLIDNRFASVPSLRVNVPSLFTAWEEASVEAGAEEDTRHEA